MQGKTAYGTVARHKALHPHLVCAMEVMFGASAGGRRLKLLNKINDHGLL
jgi:hypothetical protein